MKTIQSRNAYRGHRRGARYYNDDEFSQSGLEDGYRNEDYYFDRVQRRRGYDNRDHGGSNYWPAGDRVREERSGWENDYVPEFNYGQESNARGSRRATGYGNEGSPSMREFDAWSRDREPEGYFGRNSNDYRSGYGDRDRYYYNPGDMDRRGWRRNEARDNRNPYADPSDYGRRDDHGYGEYESYPSYRSSQDDRWSDRGYDRPGGRFRDRSENDYPRRHRPGIRDKRY